MPKLSVTVPHDMEQDQAVERLKERFGDLQRRFGDSVQDFEEQWDGNVLSYRFTTLGVKVRGTVTAVDSHVTVTAELPLLAMALKGTIETQIRSELEKILA
jgi:putative polyhydroxyalkanoate system protein